MSGRSSRFAEVCDMRALHSCVPRPVMMASLALFAAGASGISDAQAQYRRVVPRFAELPPTEARGCYWERGREYCGSYCYWEVNGKRYCQRRLRDAHSQAPIETFVEDFVGLK